MLLPVLFGRNPVTEALRAGRNVRRLYVQETAHGGSLVELEGLARRARVPIERVERRALDRIANTDRHQGVAAEVLDFDYADLDDILDRAKASGDPPFILVLDSIQDPQNLGALIRTAEAVGVHGVVIPKRRSAGVTPVVEKASAGATEHIPIAEVTNLAQTIQELKKQGVWSIGLDASAKQDDSRLAPDLPVAVVVGSEGQGLSRLVRDRCDLLLRLPMRGKINSLNAAVAGSIVLYNLSRARQSFQASERG
jgi:23S rRNA (guanosine2251-2'-O)-methyltransferase